MACDVTVTDIYAESQIGDTAKEAAAAANQTAAKKLPSTMNWPACTSSAQLSYKQEVPGITGLLSLSRKLADGATLITGEPRKSTFLFQQLSIALRRGNAVAFLNTFDSD